VSTDLNVRLRDSPAFRDLGGTATDDGRRVRPGRLFRADALTALAAPDRAVIDRLGLRLVCDLRGHAERARAPALGWLQPAPRTLHLDIATALAADVAPFVERLGRGRDAAAAAAMMRATYAALPRAAAPSLQTLFKSLCDGELPVLVHCTAGKDRTGFVTAMILSALGVGRNSVYADYLRGSGRDPQQADQPSAHALETMIGRRLDPEEAGLVHGVRRDYLDAAFAAIERGWGGTTGYLQRAAGLDADRLMALRALLSAPDRA